MMDLESLVDFYHTADDTNTVQGLRRLFQRLPCPPVLVGADYLTLSRSVLHERNPFLEGTLAPSGDVSGVRHRLP